VSESGAAARDGVVHLLVPYWGDPALLDQTVASVLAQDDDRWALTIVDDCYPDPTAQQRWDGHPDPRVTYVRNDTNLGVTGNFERCRTLVAHELAAFPGCDDLLHPSYVRRVRGAVDAFPEAAVFQPGVHVVDEHGAEVHGLAERVKSWLRPNVAVPTLLGGERLATGLLHGDWLYWPSLAFRSAALAGRPFRQDLPVILDLALVMDVITDGGGLVLDPEVCFTYRRHDASASSTARFDGQRFSDEERFHREVGARLDELGWRRARRAARWHATSRLHAVALLPGALRTRDCGQVGPLIGHALGRAQDLDQ
jgi:glycosyltransferase involved in cell wall biosynthesis